MLRVSESTLEAVVEKAHQQDPDDFVEDFLAQLRLENKEIHELTQEWLDRFITEFSGLGEDYQVVKCVANKEEVLHVMIEKCAERNSMAFKARSLAAALLGLVYKCVRAEIEARELAG